MLLVVDPVIYLRNIISSGSSWYLQSIYFFYFAHKVAPLMRTVELAHRGDFFWNDHTTDVIESNYNQVNAASV